MRISLPVTRPNVWRTFNHVCGFLDHCLPLLFWRESRPHALNISIAAAVVAERRSAVTPVGAKLATVTLQQAEVVLAAAGPAEAREAARAILG